MRSRPTSPPLAGDARPARHAHPQLPTVWHGVRRRYLVQLILVGLRVIEKVLAEKLSQDYVHDIRMGLLRRIIVDGSMRSLGVAVTRTSNDLTAVKNWVALGIAPLAVGIPLLLGTAGALAVLSPALAVGLLVPVGLFVASMAG